MSNDGFLVPSKEEFATQKKIHDKIRDSIHVMVSSFDTKHADIQGKLDKDHVGHYNDWWNSFRKSLLDHADIHDKLGQHLNDAATTYYAADQQIAQQIQDKHKNL